MPLLPVTPATERIYRIQNDPNAVQERYAWRRHFRTGTIPIFPKSGGVEQRLWWILRVEAHEQYPGRQSYTMAFTVTSRTIFSKAPGS